MPLFGGQEEQPEDNTYDEINGMADRLGIEGEARDNYIHDHMTQLGYEHVMSRESYRLKQTDGGPPPESAQSRWGFGGGQQQQQQRAAAGGQRPTGGQRMQGQRPPQGDNQDSF